ncbi:MAG: formylglycine-generating enzyme family protein [Chloroflexota bacterium]
MRASALRDFTFTTVTVNEAGNVTSRPNGVGQYFPEDLGSLDLDMVAIPGGAFVMGSPADEAGRSPAEGPQHEVTVPDFSISRYQVTQAQYAALIGHNPAQIQAENSPVECVNWFEARAFCQRLSDLTGRHYRLPSEAEWEYACRAGSTSTFAFGPTITDQLANTYAEVPYAAAAPGRHREGPTTVGMYPANAFGLHDMHGNLFEWCEDLFHADFQGAPDDATPWRDGPGLWPESYVLRGASWVNPPVLCRSAFRFGMAPIYKSIVVGFRVVCDPA